MRRLAILPCTTGFRHGPFGSRSRHAAAAAAAAAAVLSGSRRWQSSTATGGGSSGEKGAGALGKDTAAGSAAATPAAGAEQVPVGAAAAVPPPPPAGSAPSAVPPPPPGSPPPHLAAQRQGASDANTEPAAPTPAAGGAAVSAATSDSSSGLASSSLVTPPSDDTGDDVRWVQAPFVDPASLPIIDENGQYIVSRVKWVTGEVAYTTPAPPDTAIAPRFGYSIVQVKKSQTYWQFYRSNPHFSYRFLNVQFLFLLFLAYFMAFLVDEYRFTVERMKTPGAMAGEHRGKGPVGHQTQKITFTTEEITALAGTAQQNWVDGKNEDSYIGSKNYMMKKIARPTEMTFDNIRKR